MRPVSVLKNIRCVAPLFLILVLHACRPGVPKDIIQPGKLEKILYDYHLAEGMAYADGNYTTSETKKMEYRKAVFEKHGITEAEFDSALVYYYRHSDKLHDIYVKVSKRLQDESVAYGSNPNNNLGQFGNLTTVGDTALVWKEEASVVLMPFSPFNVVSFSVKPDSAFQKGDKVLLNFDTQFMFQEGSKDAVAYLSLTYSNDSVATQILHIYSDSHYSLQLTDDHKLGLKVVKGFVGLMRGKNNDSETLKLLSLKNLCVIRMRSTPQLPEAEEKPDSIGIRSSSDTLPSTIPAVEEGPRHKIPPRTLQEKLAAEGLERHK